MTLTLADVRNKRFRMARKSGYEVLEVDEFVDEVEAAFEQLTDENANLKKQIDSLKAGAGAPSTGPQSAVTQQADPSGPPAAPQTGPQTIVVTSSKEASTAVTRLVEMSTDHAEQLVVEATEEAGRIREDANRTAHQVTTEARTQAERIESEARVEADRVQGDATSRAEAMDREIEARRRELFGDLDKQREDLVITVDQLRTFEAAYRENLATELRERLDSLAGAKAEPDEVPDAANAPIRRDDASNGRPQSDGESDEDPPTLGGGSNTPRLDALLGPS